MRAGLERSDLEQVAAIGLIKAADRYDAAMRTPFEAFAWIMVVGELMHYVRDHERLVRLPRRLHVLERRYAATLETLSVELGRAPRDSEIGKAMGIVSTTVAELRRARESHQVLPLHDPGVAAKAYAPLADCDDVLPLEDRLLLKIALASLSQLERRVVVGLYLLGMTNLELARRMRISPKRVSRLHGTALTHLQRVCAGAT